MQAGPNREVAIVQQLRGIAALLVVVHHACGRIDWLFDPGADLFFGTGGVDIFFIISGFVMFVAARREQPAEFYYKRIIRIVPLYWIATIVFFAMRLPHYHEPGGDVYALFKSLAFIPYRRVPGAEIQPFLVPGWSLNVEILFYAIFGIGLALRRPGTFSTGVIAMLVAAGIIFSPTAAPLALYTRPILLEFVLGLGLGALWASGRFPKGLALLGLLGTAAMLLSDVAGGWAALVRAVSALLIMVGGLSFEAAGRVWHNRLSRDLGNASYAIYLFHTPTLMILRPIFARIPIHGWPQFIAFIAVALATSAAVGLVVHRLVEQPLMDKLRPRRVPRQDRL